MKNDKVKFLKTVSLGNKEFNLYLVQKDNDAKVNPIAEFAKCFGLTKKVEAR